ncbi:uncharacterized protein LOC135125937 [Zophobas morio]|uniref:uncharacterized protein LOC135125937 n=1 Tax=Zophobas morio TaxID=2755281 RepID=UPI003082F9F5
MFFYVAGLELAWRGCEGVNVTIKHFKEESDNCGLPTGRIEYNCIFSKTAQGGSHKLTDSKWLATNTTDPRICPVRLYKKMLSKRGKHITTDRLFLTPNPAWREPSSVGWFKNSPVGRNEMGKWTRTAAEEIGIDIKKKKISNHSLRSTAVSQLAKAGVGEEQLIKITGHANTFSIKPYLQLDGDHHYQMIDKLRANSTAMEESNNKSTNCAPSALVQMSKNIVTTSPSTQTPVNYYNSMDEGACISSMHRDKSASEYTTCDCPTFAKARNNVNSINFDSRTISIDDDFPLLDRDDELNHEKNSIFEEKYELTNPLFRISTGLSVVLDFLHVFLNILIKIHFETSNLDCDAPKKFQFDGFELNIATSHDFCSGPTVIELRRGDTVLHLGPALCREIIALDETICYRLKFLEELQFCNFYNNMIRYLKYVPPEKIYYATTANLHCMKELLAQRSFKVFADLASTD